MTPSHTVRRGVRYNYYVCTGTSKGRRECPNARVSAPQIESAVFAQLIELLKSPTLVRRIADQMNMPAGTVRGNLANVTELWDALFPVEKQRLMHLLVESATLNGETMDVRIKVPGACEIIREMEDGNDNGGRQGQHHGHGADCANAPRLPPDDGDDGRVREAAHRGKLQCGRPGVREGAEMAPPA